LEWRLPGMPLPVVCAFLVLAVFAGSPFGESALIPLILDGEQDVVGTALKDNHRPVGAARRLCGRRPDHRDNWGAAKNRVTSRHLR